MATNEQGLRGQQLLGQLAMSLIENLEEDYGDEFSINVAGIIVDVTWKDDEGKMHSQINFKSTDPRRWIQEALFNRGARIARSNA